MLVDLKQANKKLNCLQNQVYGYLLRRDLRRIILTVANKSWQDVWWVSWWGSGVSGRWREVPQSTPHLNRKILTFLQKRWLALPLNQLTLEYSWTFISYLSPISFQDWGQREEILLSTYVSLASLNPFSPY